MTTRKMAAVLVVPILGGAAAVAMQWRDISRYVKIERMSFGNGKPGIVPAVGSKRYPDGPGQGVLDGTGAFDSASRGGPAQARAEESAQAPAQEPAPTPTAR